VLREHAGLLAIKSIAFYGIVVKLFDQLAVKILLFWGGRWRVGSRGIHVDGFPACLVLLDAAYEAGQPLESLAPSESIRIPGDNGTSLIPVLVLAIDPPKVSLGGGSPSFIDGLASRDHGWSSCRLADVCL
jgi:hypothetical protein